MLIQWNLSNLDCCFFLDAANYSIGSLHHSFWRVSHEIDIPSRRISECEGSFWLYILGKKLAVPKSTHPCFLMEITAKSRCESTSLPSPQVSRFLYQKIHSEIIRLSSKIQGCHSIRWISKNPFWNSPEILRLSSEIQGCSVKSIDFPAKKSLKIFSLKI